MSTLNAMGIPKITDKRIKELLRTIRPVISLTTLPMGRWSHEEVKTYFLKLPGNLRGNNFLNQEHFSRPVRLVQEMKTRTLHEPFIDGKKFHPSIAEVLAQIPDYLLDPGRKHNIVAFETFLEEHDPKYDNSGMFHVATTVFLSKGSPVSGKMMTHYS